MTAAPVDLAIEDPSGARAVRLNRETYFVARLDVIDAWIIDHPTALPPYNQFLLTVTGRGEHQQVFSLSPVPPDRPIRPSDGLPTQDDMPRHVGYGGFHADDPDVHDMCRMIAHGIVGGTIHVGMSWRAWGLVIDGTLALVRGVRAEQGDTRAVAPFARPVRSSDLARMTTVGDSGFDASSAIIEEILAALDEADPVKYAEPTSAAQRIRALGDRARQITDTLAGAHDRLAQPVKPTHPEELLSRMGGTYAVVADVIAECKRAEVKFPDQHLPDGTGRPGDAQFADAMRWTCQTNTPEQDNWRDVLAEEVAEAFAETNPAKLRAELLQVCAVAVRWIEDIDGWTVQAGAA